MSVFKFRSEKPEIFNLCRSVETPVARKLEHRHEAHGHYREDPYQWMRLSDEQKEAKDPDEQTREVIGYLNSENEYREKVTAHLCDFENKLFEEIKSRIKQTDMSVPYLNNGYYYITRYEEGKEYPVYTRRKGSQDGPEEILLDVNSMAEGYEYYHVGSFEVSPDNQWIAYSVDQVSRRQYTIFFKNLHNGEVLAESIPKTSGNIVWANDNKHLFYSVKDKALRDYKILRHELGTSVSHDVEIYHEKDEAFHVFVFKTRSEHFLVIGSSATLSNEFRILEAAQPLGEFRLFHPREPKLEYEIDHHDNQWYVLTNADGAFNFKVMHTPVGQTDRAYWRDYIPHKDSVFIEGIDCFRDFIVIEQREGGNTRIRIRDWSEIEHEIAFEEKSYTVEMSANPEFDTHMIRLSYTSLTTPSTVYDYEVGIRKLHFLKQQEVIGTFSSADYTTELIQVRARDGVIVPMSVVYHRDYPKNGTMPLLLYGYGSYGISMDPMFSSARLSLLDRGFAFAIAHIRGGQEMGRKWYESGKFFDKKNTFNDFIDCGQYLIDHLYCGAQKLFAMGGSAGGLLMGAVINQAPRLWAGVVAAVPFVDVVSTMLDDSIPLTTGEFDEWGNPAQKDFYDYMLSYSPYDNVMSGLYPPMLVTTGFHDSQVQYWEPAKWVAKIRDLKTDQNPLIMFCNMDTGHGGASGRFRRLKEIAMEYTFLLELSGLVLE